MQYLFNLLLDLSVSHASCGSLKIVLR